MDDDDGDPAGWASHFRQVVYDWMFSHEFILFDLIDQLVVRGNDACDVMSRRV